MGKGWEKVYTDSDNSEVVLIAIKIQKSLVGIMWVGGMGGLLKMKLKYLIFENGILYLKLTRILKSKL